MSRIKMGEEERPSQNKNNLETIIQEVQNTGGGSEPEGAEGESSRDKALREVDELFKDLD